MTIRDFINNNGATSDQVFEKYEEFNKTTREQWDKFLNTEIDTTKGNLQSLLSDVVDVQKEAFAVDKVLAVAIIYTYHPKVRRVLFENGVQQGDWYEIIRNILLERPKSSTTPIPDYIQEYVRYYI